MSPGLRRTLASIFAWLVGAVVAVSVGVLALSAIGDGWAAGTPQALQADGAGQLATPQSPDPPAPTPTPSAAASRSRSAPHRSPSATLTTNPPVTQVRTLVGRGGTVVAQCTGTIAYLRSWSPDQGYQVDEVHRGPAPLVSVKFGMVGHEYLLPVRCAQGIPQIYTGHVDD